MQTSVLIIGQGISGTFLSYYLHRAGVDHLIIDQTNPHTPSAIAAGIINPVTGRRIVKTWMINTLLPFAQKAYDEIEQLLDITVCNAIPIAECHTSLQMKNAFESRYQEDPSYLSIAHDQHHWDPYLHGMQGWGEIKPALLIHLPHLIKAYRSYALNNGLLLEDHFDINALEIKDTIRYKDIQCKKIIFCDGITAANTSFFKALPFAGNKGEALLVKISDLPRTHIIKKGMNLVPWPDELFWLGSVYQREFNDVFPSNEFYQMGKQWLDTHLKLPYEITGHYSAIRPATLERRPFVGFHPYHPSVGILNGMGTKGCSLAPYFAHQLTQHIVSGTEIETEASLRRFQYILGKSF